MRPVRNPQVRFMARPVDRRLRCVPAPARPLLKRATLDPQAIERARALLRTDIEREHARSSSASRRSGS